MALSGNDVVEVFKLYCTQHNKLFVPDSPRQEEVSDSLASHYDSDDLLEAIKWYTQKEDGPVLIFDFALKSRDYVERVKKERASVDKFKKTVEDTRKLIEQNEL